MSNKIKLIIVGALILILGSITVMALNITNNHNSKSLANVSTTSSSSFDGLNYTNSLKSSSQSQSSSNLNSSSFQSSPNPSSSTGNTVNSIQNSNNTQDQPKIEYIDSQNPPQYIKDYLSCDTKDLKDDYDSITHISFFERVEGQVQYQCPPNIRTLGCKNNVTLISHKNEPSTFEVIKNNNSYLSPYKFGWNCDLFNPVNFIKYSLFNSCNSNISTRQFENGKYFLQRIDDTTCLIEYKSKSDFNDQKNLELINQIQKTDQERGSDQILRFIILK